MLLILFAALSVFANEPKLAKLKLPPGFSIGVYALAADARSLALAPDGTVFVGTRTEGKVYAVLPDKNGDGKSDGVITLFKGLDMPNGVAFKGQDLYVAERSQVWVIKNVLRHLKDPKKEKFGPKFPSDKNHGWKFIAFGPDGWLYVPIGAPCNICDKDQDLYAAIHKISPDGKTRQLVARGVRNTVGFDWQPGTEDFWFTDNGRDWMGDDKPPCELNRLVTLKEHFGFPYCHGTDIVDPEFGKGKNCRTDYSPPRYEFTAHSAPLGMRFLRNAKSKLKNKMLVALHGSWNRSTLSGYEVVMVETAGQSVLKVEPFITGFKEGKMAWGRPVDIQEMADGSILISDDAVGALYRITPVAN